VGAPTVIRTRTRLLGVLAFTVALAGCGGSSSSQPAATTQQSAPNVADAMQALIKTAPSLAGTVRTLFQETSWAVVETRSGNHASAVAFHLIGGHWQPETTGSVKVEILGPAPGARAPLQPQVAAAVSAPTRLVDTGLWIDGGALVAKGAGSPTSGTIYGAPLTELARGRHVAVAYARTASAATAVAWVFNV